MAFGLRVKKTVAIGLAASIGCNYWARFIPKRILYHSATHYIVLQPVIGREVSYTSEPLKWKWRCNFINSTGKMEKLINLTASSSLSLEITDLAFDKRNLSFFLSFFIVVKKKVLGQSQKPKSAVSVQSSV